jgi:hypothetical protein
VLKKLLRDATYLQHPKALFESVAKGEESGQFTEGLLVKVQEDNLFLCQQLHCYDVFGQTACCPAEK